MLAGKQLHLSDTYELLSEVQFVNVRNDESCAFMKKPMRKTGIWTSTWREETRDSDWVEWCRCNDFDEPYNKHWHLFTPKEDTRLFVIESHFHLLHLIKRYSWETPLALRLNQGMTQIIADPYFVFLDFERLAQEYDGIWLTERGNGSTHLSYPHDLNGWDCECVLWFRWCFTEVERIVTPAPPHDE